MNKRQFKKAYKKYLDNEVPMQPRELRRFWRALERYQMAGNIGIPGVGMVSPDGRKCKTIKELWPEQEESK